MSTQKSIITSVYESKNRVCRHSLFCSLLDIYALGRLADMSQNTYEDKSSTLCLDASEIRRVRESQQLTQLYVSKVVGVTTDTISRWENNRYPTIRRENALKLAEALEVPLEDILLKPVEASQEEPEVLKKSTIPWLLAGSLAIVALVIFATLFSRLRIMDDLI